VERLSVVVGELVALVIEHKIEFRAIWEGRRLIQNEPATFNPSP